MHTRESSAKLLLPPLPESSSAREGVQIFEPGDWTKWFESGTESVRFLRRNREIEFTSLEVDAVTIAERGRADESLATAEVFSWSELPELFAAEDLFDGMATAGWGSPDRGYEIMARDEDDDEDEDEDDVDDDDDEEDDDDFEDDDEEDDDESDDDEDEEDADDEEWEEVDDDDDEEEDSDDEDEDDDEEESDEDWDDDDEDEDEDEDWEDDDD